MEKHHIRTNTAPDFVYTPTATPHCSVVQRWSASHVLLGVMERYYTTDDTLDIMELDPKPTEHNSNTNFRFGYWHNR